MAGMSRMQEASSIIENAARVVVGKKRALELMTVALLAGGHVLLADEINRTIPRTQAALLESMGEFQVTVDATTLDLPKPFFVVATQNPIEMDGTFPLPEAQLDRFLMKIDLGYPDRDEELAILDRFLLDDPLVELAEPVLTHRIILKHEERAKGVSAAQVVREILDRIDVPNV